MQRNGSVALAVLGLGAFTAGTSELTVVGILDPIADDAGVSISAAGSLVTAYAIGIAGGVISAFLLVFGIATAAGTFASGHAVDRSATAISSQLHDHRTRRH